MIDTVIFDLGGVVLESPFDVIAEYERSAGLTPGFFNQVAAGGDAWAALEEGRVSRSEFVVAFSTECRARGVEVDAGRLLDDIEAYARPRQSVLDAIDRLRSTGFTVAALTNNWESPSADWDVPGFQQHFDVFVESWVEGCRKPDPAIYLRLLERLERPAEACVFLDDIGRNLKTAGLLGMATIKVEDPDRAIADLMELVDVESG